MITLPYKSTHGFLEESQRHVLDFGAKISCTEFIGYRLASKYSKCDLIRRCFKCARTPLDTYKGISRQPPRPKLVIIRRNPVVVECCFCWALNYAFSWFHKIMYGTRSHLSLFYLNISLLVGAIFFVNYVRFHSTFCSGTKWRRLLRGSICNAS